MSLDCTFSGHALDRADGLRQNTDWIATQLGDERSRFLPCSRLRPALQLGTRLRPAWVSRSAIADGLEAGAITVLLGADADGVAHFAVDVGDRPAAEGSKYIDVRSAAAQLAATGGPDPDVAVLGLARTLIDWNARHGFCARCGRASQMIKGGFARRCTDETCGAEHFARVDPVVIMLAVDGDRCVLGRQPRFPPGMFSTLAGFIEPGESIEEAVRRELLEESNVRAGEVRYVASQPWPFPSSLMIGCIAQAQTFELVPDAEELEEVRWFSRSEIQAILAGKGKGVFIPPPMAIAHQLIRTWLTA